MPKLGTGLAGKLGVKRRDDPALYARAYRAERREASRAYARRYYHEVTKKRPEKLKAKLKAGSYTRRKRKYGITRGEYDALLHKQGGVCQICRRPDSNLRVDHCHSSGKVRGLLCSKCNLGLGHFRDNPELLYRAAHYLENHPNELDVRLNAVELKPGEFGGTLSEAIPSQAPPSGEGVTTRAKARRAKRPEAPGNPFSGLMI